MNRIDYLFELPTELKVLIVILMITQITLLIVSVIILVRQPFGPIVGLPKGGGH